MEVPIRWIQGYFPVHFSNVRGHPDLVPAEIHQNCCQRWVDGGSDKQGVVERRTGAAACAGVEDDAQFRGGGSLLHYCVEWHIIVFCWQMDESVLRDDFGMIELEVFVHDLLKG